MLWRRSAARWWVRRRISRRSIGARARPNLKELRRPRMWTSFFTWLTGQVNNFIATQVGTVSTLLEPAVITLASVYVMMWGYLQLTGKIEEPVLEGGRRILILGVILVLVFKLSQNISPLLDIFIQSPQSLAAGIVGGASPSVMGAVDTIWNQGSEVGDSL